jgi:hypothetical protein
MKKQAQVCSIAVVLERVTAAGVESSPRCSFGHVSDFRRC